MSRFKKLSHTVWECKYHIIWCPKYRYGVMQDKIRQYVTDVIRKLCRRHSVEILESNTQPDHVHLVLSIQPSYCVSRVVGFIKGKSAIQIFRKFKGLRKKYYGQYFWSRGYCVTSVGIDEKMISETYWLVWQNRYDSLWKAAVIFQEETVMKRFMYRIPRQAAFILLICMSAANDLYAQLPLGITVEEYSNNEKIFLSAGKVEHNRNPSR